MASSLRDELASLKIERSEAVRPTRSSNNHVRSIVAGAGACGCSPGCSG